MARLFFYILASLVLLVCTQGVSENMRPGNSEPNGGGGEDVYINSWAVRIIGGMSTADEVARRNGFVNKGLVPGFQDVYDYRLSGQNNVRSDAPHASSLAADKAVVFAEQQTREARVTKSYSIPEDPLFADQWYLLNTGSEYAGNDMRVEQAWLQGWTGCNVTVSIVDDGLDYKHPDLWPNFTPSASYDVVGNDTDPLSLFYSHGTSCGGIAGAVQDNEHCGSGIAHECNLGGIELLSGGVTDMEEAAALSHARDVIDIYSNSWGPPDTGFHVKGPRTLTKQVLKDGVIHGRNGKGSIYVWANGNGGDYDDCGADGFTSSIYTISVGAIGIDGYYSPFDERCSAKLVTVYVTDQSGSASVTTTRTGGLCTQRFGGTSAATPMVSGGIALALEANPSLTWRDVQYLIVYTANPQLTNGTDTETNGAGLEVSHQYGFGVMDAEAMVARARHWINVPPQMQDTVLKSNNPDGTYTVTVNYAGQIRYLEHVVVKFSVAVTIGLIRGDLEIGIISPSGTLSVLLQPRPYDDSPYETGYIDWPFMSVMFWGEDPAGQWTLNIGTRGIGGVTNVSTIEFQFYGVSQVAEAVANIPDQCHSDCRRGCAREGSNFCDSCVNLRNAYTLECINECPPGYTQRNAYCYDASQPVKECNSPLKNKEGTGFTPEYEKGSCADYGFFECCTSGSCSPSSFLLPPSLNCYCDQACHLFGDCCEDIDLVGCPAENVTQMFPYIELGEVDGIETQLVDPYRPPTVINVPFPFVFSIESNITVSRTGFFGFEGPYYDQKVLPFHSYFNESTEPSVSYEIHEGSRSQDILSYVDSIIHEHESTSFATKWLLLVTWEDLYFFYSDDKKNTFQGMLATDFARSYAVFTYRCGDLSYSDPGEIGYIHPDDGVYVFHGASERDNPHDIACVNMPHSPWVNVVYEITRSDNECDIDNGDCEQICVDNFSSYTCACEDGYALDLDGYTCRDIDECAGPDHGCDQDCLNSEGSYYCSCFEGYELSSDGRMCNDINECLGQDHECEYSCENTVSSYTCGCDVGFELNTDGRTCRDIDECVGPEHGCQKICENTVGSYYCNCSTGYVLNADGLTCDDIDECLLSDQGCEVECENTDGSFVCKCGEGYHLDTDYRSCIDNDECLGDHDCEHNCTNTIGSYTCICDEGFELKEDQRTCKDIDECLGRINDCEHNCMNTEGSYICSCGDGYALNEDGLTCSVSCNGTFTDLLGYFETPDWPGSYPIEDFTCVWEITIDSSEASILIQFQEPYGVFGSEPCETDYVEVFSGVGSTTTSVAKHCDVSVPDRILVNSSRATVVFRGSTHSQMNRPGVSVVYRAIVEEIPFIPLLNVDGAVARVDDGLSEPITIANGFPLGCMRKSKVYVGTNGYFAFSEFAGFTPFPFSEGNGLSLVAPFFTDIDISKGSGRILYEVHDDLSVMFSREIAEQVNLVINTNKQTNFSSQWLLVSKWEDVSPYGNYQTKASFQGVLATDHERSFAIFIYKCEDENARFSNRATIGYVTSDGGYANHEATFSNNPYSISCLDYPARRWTNVIYEIQDAHQRSTCSKNCAPN